MTPVLQYLVTEGRLVLHRVAKSGLMGFADPAPRATAKQLYVAYWHRGVVYETRVEDMGLLELPQGGGEIGGAAATAVTVVEPGRAAMLMSRATALFGISGDLGA